MEKLNFFKILKPNTLNAISAFVFPVAINVIFYKSNHFLRFLNFGINLYGYSLTGFLIQFAWIYVVVSLISHFIILKLFNKIKTRWKQKRELGNLWFESIKFNRLFTHFEDFLIHKSGVFLV